EVQVHTDLFSRGYMSASVLNRLKSLIARFVLRRADTIRVVSQSIVHSLPQSLQHKAFVLPIYTELADDTELEEKLKEKFRSFSFKVLMVGRLESEKRIEEALNIFAKL